MPCRRPDTAENSADETISACKNDKNTKFQRWFLEKFSVSIDPHRLSLILGRGYGAPPQTSTPQRSGVSRLSGLARDLRSLHRAGEDECWSELFKPYQLVENVGPDLPEYCLKYVKFGRLIIRKIIETVPTRCQIFRLKCTKFHLLGVAYSAPQTTSKKGEGRRE